ncbi:hypothetical protein KG088_18920 [Halomonas sp. TRM85114]|uniref:hypothetical protein n=1 Tax=Halomonas jincaotanensis TaxID=2810616 RepID=UPI001BD6B1F8|nr:hypothetical protein [Halomonas jincaotanensis]MBS9405662.1 hypothetical protein [Halomonas jincaotanensis]
MENLIAFLNQNSGALTVVFTGVVTLATMVYAALTAILVSETRKLRQVQTEPRIEITVDVLDFSVNIVRLCVRNIGEGPAKNVKFEPSVIDGDEIGESLLEEFLSPNFFKTGLRYFGPGQFRFSGHTQTNKNFEAKVSSALSFKVAYESVTGKKYEEEIVVDMAELRGRYQLGKPNLYSIAKSMEMIQKDLHHITTGFKRIKVDSYESDDREREEKEREEWMREAAVELERNKK